MVAAILGVKFIMIFMNMYLHLRPMSCLSGMCVNGACNHLHMAVGYSIHGCVGWYCLLSNICVGK